MSPAAGARAWRGDLFRATPYGQVGIVSCPSIHFCAALQLNFDGIWTTRQPENATISWKLTGVGKLAFQGQPGSLSCASRTLCAAIGAPEGQPRGVVVSARPAGGPRAWKYVPLRDLRPGEAPTSIDCPGNSLCVGLAGNDGHQTDLLTSTRPDGTAWDWRLSPLPNPNIHTQALSCPSVSFCAAAGTLNGRSVVLTSHHPAGGVASWRYWIL
jgi:hypothetical protein